MKTQEVFETNLNKMLTEQVAHEKSLQTCNELFFSLGEELKKEGKTEARSRVESTTQILDTPVLLEDHLRKSSFPRERQLASLQGIKQLYENFLKQDKHHNLYDYIYDLKLGRRGEIQRAFLHTLDFTDAAIADALLRYSKEADWKLIRLAGEKFSTLPVSVWGVALQDVVTIVAKIEYQFTHLEWMPEMKFSEFELKFRTSGPVCVAGQLGFSRYQLPPQKLKESWGVRHVYGWPAGAEKNTSQQVSHCITIIGTVKGLEKAGGGYVYFLDPQDPSDPEHPELEKIYKISYRNFAENTQPFGVNYEGQNQGRPSAYAWRRN